MNISIILGMSLSRFTHIRNGTFRPAYLRKKSGEIRQSCTRSSPYLCTSQANGIRCLGSCVAISFADSSSNSIRGTFRGAVGCLRRVWKSRTGNATQHSWTSRTVSRRRSTISVAKSCISGHIINLSRNLGQGTKSMYGWRSGDCFCNSVGCK